jgi:hypothetical protein
LRIEKKGISDLPTPCPAANLQARSRPSPITLSHCDFFGICFPCQRRIVVTPAEMIERCDPDAISREVMDRIICKECGRHVETSVSNPAARGEETPSYSHLEAASRAEDLPGLQS